MTVEHILLGLGTLVVAYLAFRAIEILDQIAHDGTPWEDDE